MTLEQIRERELKLSREQKDRYFDRLYDELGSECIHADAAQRLKALTQIEHEPQ